LSSGTDDEQLAKRALLARQLGFMPPILQQEAEASIALDRDQTHAIGPVTVLCGAWKSYGGCILPARHNQGRVDIPENHQFKESTVKTFTAKRDPNEDWQGELEASAAHLLANAAGLNLKDPHGAATPARFLRMLKELTTPEEFKFTTFPNSEDNDEMITIRDIPFVSLCNHHVIPFIGTANIAYIPGDRLAGLSKFARTVKYFAHSLNVQENLTKQIADFLEEMLQPRALGVVLDAEHLCMTIRGVQAPGAQTRTASMRGFFADHDRTAKAEFMATINGGKSR